MITQAESPPASSTLPTPRSITRALGRVSRRIRAVRATRGLALALLVGSAGLALAMAGDFAWPLPLVARWVVWAIWVAVVGVIVVFQAVRPLFRRMAWGDLAAVAERADPALGERLTGSIALLDGQNRSNGSPAMVAALVDEASRHVQGFRPGRHVGGKPVLGRVMMGLLALVMVAAPALIRPDPFRTLALRSLAPWLDLDRVSRFRLSVEPGDSFSAIGADFAVEARVEPRYGTTPVLGGAWLEWTEADGTSRRTRMTDVPSSSPSQRGFTATLPRLAGSLSYRVSSDSSRSRAYRVTAVDPPSIRRLSVAIEAPAYTKVAAGNLENPDKIEVVEGSKLTLTVATSNPVADVELTWPSTKTPTKLTPASDGKTRSATVEADASGTFTLTPRRDQHAIDGKPDSRPLVVKPDAPPTLTVNGPPGLSEAAPDDVLQLALAARDDFAVSLAELHYEIRGEGSDAEGRVGHVAIKLDGLGSPVARGKVSLTLRSLDLKAGQAVAYRVKVADNRPGPKGPNVVWSEARGIKIVATAEPMLARQDRARRESLQGRLEEIRKSNTANRRETEQLRYAADTAQRDPSAWDVDRDRTLASRETEARLVVDNLQLLARDLAADGTFAPLARPARQVADVEAEAGRAQLETARKAEPGRRLAELRQADSRLGSLQNRLDELQRQFESLAKLDGDRQKLRDLASREDALAEQAARGGADRARLLAEQDEIRKVLDELLAKSPGLRAGVLAAQGDEAERLARQARELADRQRSESRKTAEGQRLDPSIRELAEVQRALEDEARHLALDVDEPLAENGRSRLDTDSLRRASETLARGDFPDSVRKLEEAEESLRRLNRDLEDLPGDPKALARRLARRQEALANDAAAVVAEFRKDDLIPDRKAALETRLKPLVDRQEAIAKLAAALKAPEQQKNAAGEAVKATARAAENFKNTRPRETEEAQNNAKRALNQLAESLPDLNRGREEARRKLEEAKRKEEEVARDVERALAESTPRQDKLDPDALAASELGEKLGQNARKAEEAAAALSALDLDPRLQPQRDRAAGRVARLANVIKAVQTQAPPRRNEAKPQPPGGWYVAGPFAGTNAALTFDPTKPVDVNTPLNGPDGKPRPWKQAPFSGGEGKVDLFNFVSRDNNLTAFGVAEVVSPSRRKAQLLIGSDDNINIWLNGRQVFEFGGSRGFTAGSDKVEVELVEGVNRLVIRCGTGSGEWGFGVSVSPPPPDGFDPAKSKKLRENLASARADAVASVTRLEQKAQGRTPADDVAAELALEQRQAAEAAAEASPKPPEDDPTARETAAKARRRMATAIRNLPIATEAPALQAEAVRQAEAAARLDAAADPKAIKEATEAAALAAENLAHRLADDLAPRAQAAALARAERALDRESQSDPTRAAERQRAIATELAHKPMSAQPTPAEIKAEAAVDLAVERADVAKRGAANPPVDGGANASASADALAREDAVKALEAMANDPALGPDPVARPALTPTPTPRPMPALANDPDLPIGPDQAVRASDLARRERQVRERLQAVLAERVAPQEVLRRDASNLAREMTELRDRAREIKARGQYQAQAAAELLGEQAPRAMDRGSDQLAQGKLDNAKDSQREVADLIERAARNAEDLAAALKAEGASEANPTATATAKTNAATGLSDVRSSLRRLSGQLGQGKAQGQEAGQAQAQAAAPGMRQAADGLRAAAQGSGTSGPPIPGEGEPASDAATANTNPTPKPGAAGVADADLTALQDLVRKKTGRQWGELPGHLRTEILQLSKGRYRDDYARLIQLYFREIAADGGKVEKP